MISFFNTIQKIKYSTLVDKYDRHGYKQRPRVLILTDKYLYGLDALTLKLRDQISTKSIQGISTSKLSDGFIVLHFKLSNKEKGSYKKVYNYLIFKYFIFTK